MPMFRTGSGSPFPTGTNPVSNATADLDGDGHLDLLFVNYITDNVSVLFGGGNGAFVAGTPVPVTNGPRQIMVGDLDGDGDIDFLATNYSGNNVSVALNNGNGTFTPGTSVPVGTVPRGLGLGDLDGDGDLDFVSVNYQSNNLSVMINNGHAAFTAKASSPIGTGGTRPVQMVMADLDGDHDLDLAVTNNPNNNVGLLFNKGHGNFFAATTTPTGAGPRGIAAGDINGDGDIDLVVTNFGAASVSILRNNGTGAFSAAAAPVTTGNNPYDVKLGDLDGDGDLDMVVSNSGSSSLSVFQNNGKGKFTPATGSPFAVGVSPGGIILGDFDEDGDLDISSSNFGSNTTSILINTASFYSLTSATSNREGTAAGSGGELVFTIRRTATSEAEDITYALGGTATAGNDYIAPSGTVSFAEGQKVARIHVSITPDHKYEHNEGVVVTLTGANGSGTINPAAAKLRGTIRNDDPLSGTNHDDNLRGSNGGETINGKGGDDHILAKGGSDQIFGGNGNDRILAGGGNDRIFGNDGRDHILGGAGRDVMAGGSGDDFFVFTAIGASAPNQRLRDIVTDFRHGHDKIDLSAIDANSHHGGNQSFSWHGSDNFVSGKAGWLIERTFDRAGTANDETVIFGDVDGDARADFQIELSGLKSLGAADFLL